LPEGELAWAGECAEPFLIRRFVSSAEVGVGGGEFVVEGAVCVACCLRPGDGLLEQRERLLRPSEIA